RQLLREIWGPRHEEDTHYLRVHIAHLRQKLGDSDPENRIIRAESGLGYRIAADGAE
ncbi:winged helix-turn-helix domain-containing protein, partial [Akkermansia sp.]